MQLRHLAIATLCQAALAATARAQDPFAIEVYRPRPQPRGEWELETHFNYVARGTRTVDGLMAPTDHQAHLALELGGGLTRFADIAGYLLLARQPGSAPDYAGWRVRARLGGPDGWSFPIGLVGELGQALTPYSEGGTTLELTPVVGRQLGRLDLVANASVERGFGSSAQEAEWELEPSARVAYAVSPRATVELEYHGVLGPLDALLASGEQRHQIYPGVTLKLGDDLAWNLGIGIGLTSDGDRVRLKTRLEIPLLEPRGAH